MAFAALSISLVYVGDASVGFDARHPGRIAVVDEQGSVLLDVLIRPQAPLLDCRTHMTGLTPECFEGEYVVELDTACSELMALLSPHTLLAGYRVVSELQALGMWHGPLIDVALLYGVESRKSSGYHSMRFMAEQVLGDDLGPGDDDPNDAVERARLTMRLVHHEALHQASPTPPFPPRELSGSELVVRHIPHSWGASAAATLQPLMPAARLSRAVRWLLLDDDPTDWRGEAKWKFPNKELCDAAFEALPGLTDVFVGWKDQPGAVPLGTFLSEQALISAFSDFGVVISARVPRKPMTKEPQSFAFISFLDEEEAQRAAKKVVEVAITPEWKLELRPRIANSSAVWDKRVGVRVSNGPDAEWEFDWVHICRR